MTPERVEEVAHHYELFGGVSPLTRADARAGRGLAERLRARGYDLPVYVGMRNWHPFLADTLAEMSRAGVRRAVGFIAARASQLFELRCSIARTCAMRGRRCAKAGLPDVEVTYVDDWHTHPRLHRGVGANGSRPRCRELPAGAARTAPTLVFTAHSIPCSMAQRYPYQAAVRRRRRD